jgi:hypothetical protein
MSNKSDRKSLALTTETLRTLSGATLEGVAGGAALPTIPTTTTTITRTLSLVRACVTV